MPNEIDQSSKTPPVSPVIAATPHKDNEKDNAALNQSLMELLDTDKLKEKIKKKRRENARSALRMDSADRLSPDGERYSGQVRSGRDGTVRSADSNP